jgi:hypothetical protein
VKCKYLYIIVLLVIISINSCGNGGSVDALPDQPTFANDIAPILQKNCLPCHREQGAAPFSLASYAAVKKRAKTIAKVTQKRIMPPWPADPSYSHFVGEKVLTDRDIAIIQKWVKQGAVEGDQKYVYCPNAIDRSNIRKPDLVIPFDSVVMHEGDLDRFFISLSNVSLPKRRFISALEFVPTEPGLVHHANGHLLLYKEGSKRMPIRPRRKMEARSEMNSDLGSLLEMQADDGSLPMRIHSAFNYLPGVQGIEYPNGIGAFEVTKDFAAVMNDVHYGPADKTVVDRSVLNVFFTDIPPSRVLSELMLGTNGVSKIVPPLVVPANKVTKHATRFTIAEDISVLTINPHLHMLGKSFLAFAVKPNGDTIPLIRILRWNFNWQYFYTYKTMLRIPAGSEIVAIAEFDNTSNNPWNPNRPPKQVSERWDSGGASMRASDEMFQFIITYTLYKKGDEFVSLEKK